MWQYVYSGSHFNFLKRCHDQTKLYFSLGLNGNIFLVLHLWSKLLNLSLSPPFSPPPIFSYLVSPSPMLQYLDSCFSRISKFDVGMFSFGQLRYQAQSKRCANVQSFNMSFLFIMLFVFGFLHISKSLGISNMAPL